MHQALAPSATRSAGFDAPGKLKADPGRKPPWLHTVRGKGVRLEPTPDLPSAPATTTLHVPTALAHQITQALRTHRLVTVLGPGGIGKTRALMELAREHPVVWCELTTAAGRASVEERLRVALGAHSPVGQGRIEQGLGSLDRAWVVLDGAESVVNELRHCLGGWLDASHNHVRFVVTSRTRLEHQSEHVVRAEPMTVEQALALLRARAGDDAITGIERLARALDRLPLGLELAAAALATCTPDELCARLDQRLDVLTQAGRAPRHASLRDVLAHSWELLPPQLRQVLAELCTFHDGFTLDAAEAVVGPAALRWLRALEGHSLVYRRERRFWTYRTVWLFAREHLATVGAAPAAQRHQAWCATWAEQRRDPTQPTGSAPIDAALRAELANLLAATQIPAADERVAALLVDVLEAPLLAQRALDELDRVISWGLATTETPATRARMLLQRANSGYLGHNLERARHDVAEVLTLVPDDAACVAKALTCRTLMGVRQGRWAEAETAARGALTSARQTGHALSIVASLSNLAMVLRNQGRIEDARAALVEALGWSPTGAIGATVLMNLGIANAGLGALEEAEAQALAALDQLDEGVRLDLQGRCHGLVGEIQWLRGTIEPALHHLDTALALHRTEGAPDAEALVLRRRARVHLAQGHWHHALQDADAGLAVVPADSAPIRGALHVLRGTALLALGRNSEVPAEAHQARRHIGDAPALLTLEEAWRGEPPQARTDPDHDARAVFAVFHAD